MVIIPIIKQSVTEIQKSVKLKCFRETSENTVLKGVLNPNFRPFSFELKKKEIF